MQRSSASHRLHTPRISIVSIFAVLAMALVGCGGGGGENLFGGGTQATDPDTPAGGTTNTVIGANINDTFVPQQLALGVDNLSAGGTTTVTVNFVDANNSPITDVLQVVFTSECVADGVATLTGTVATVNGQATSTYTAQGCVGTDEISATATVDGVTLRAIATLTVAQDTIGSLEFVSADPTDISFPGTGRDETSLVTFRVVGATGAPVPQATVNFTLTTDVGGITLDPASATSGNDGTVSTTVRSGSVATPVSVIATEATTNISTQSSSLVVSTGLPDDDSFSLSTTSFNPNGFNVNGTNVSVTISAADAFNNLIPDGTPISFFAEGGAIQASCLTANGTCTVTWTSQDPRPVAANEPASSDPTNNPSETRNARAQILATAIGNESFRDQNGNGRFDAAETAADFTDIGEAFADENENGIYDPGEFFVDFNSNGQRDGPNGLYNGVLCSDPAPALCDTQNTSVNVFEQFTMRMSSPIVDLTSLNATVGAGAAADIAVGDPITVNDGVNTRIIAVIRDQNGNPMPEGTTAVFAGDGVGSQGTVSLTQGNTANSGNFGEFLRFDFLIFDQIEQNAVLTLTVTSGGLQPQIFSWPIQ